VCRHRKILFRGEGFSWLRGLQIAWWSCYQRQKTDFLLDGVTRAGLKMLLNALSTCTMVRLGRVMGNFMIWVVPSNLKLIDRATRYIQKLSGLEYGDSNRLLFEAIEYIEPRMKADRAYSTSSGPGGLASASRAQ
jgi:hypothetical protein